MSEKVTVGLSVEAHGMLQMLKESGYFREMVDGYRFAIGMALASNSAGSQISGRKNTFVNVGTLDRDGTLQRVISSLTGCADDNAYAVAEELAEWGVRELDRRSQAGHLDVAELLDELAAGEAEESESSADAAD